MKRRDNLPAFPNNECFNDQKGMTVREHLIARIAQGLATRTKFNNSPILLAKTACKAADHILNIEHERRVGDHAR